MKDKKKELEKENLQEEVKETPEELKEELSEEIPEETNEEKLAKEVEEWKNKYYRAYADTENQRKRLENEAMLTNKYRIQSFALEILPVLDNLERALSNKSADEALQKGVQMVHDQLWTALEKEGVSVIEALDKPFDGNFHHAILSEHIEDKEAGMVIEVLQKGYMLKDRILRAALVKVSE